MPLNPVEEFLADQGMEKTAMGEQAASWAARHPILASTISGVAAPLLLMGAHEGYQEVKSMVGRARGYRNMVDYNPEIGEMDAKKTKALFNTLHNAAPDLARDPVVASSWVKQMAYKDEYVDPRTLADLGSAQQRIARSGPDMPIAQITQGIMSQVGGIAEQQRRAEEFALKQQQFEQQKARDVVSTAKDMATASKDKAQRAYLLEQTKEKIRSRMESERNEAETARGQAAAGGLFGPPPAPSSFAQPRSAQYQPQQPFGGPPGGGVGKVSPRNQALAAAQAAFKKP